MQQQHKRKHKIQVGLYHHDDRNDTTAFIIVYTTTICMVHERKHCIYNYNMHGS